MALQPCSKCQVGVGGKHVGVLSPDGVHLLGKKGKGGFLSSSSRVGKRGEWTPSRVGGGDSKIEMFARKFCSRPEKGLLEVGTADKGQGNDRQA